MRETSDSSEWTQEALGLRVGEARRTIIAIERGRYNPTLELAFKLADEFGDKGDEVFSYRTDEDGA